MDKLLETAQFYQKELEGHRYLMIIAKKGVVLPLEIVFSKSEFKHLAGLHKLRDTEIYAIPSEQLYLQILNKKTKMSQFIKSNYFNDVKQRLDNFEKIKEVLNAPNDVKRSLRGLFGISIDADYLLTQKTEEENCHLFLKINEQVLLPVTFFTNNTDYYLKKNTVNWNIVSINELKEKDDVKRKIQIETIKAQLSATTDFTKMKEITKDVLATSPVNFSKLDEHEKD